MARLIPSATAVILRPGCRQNRGEDTPFDSGFQVLLLRRNAKLATHGGSWVFPGGKIDQEDCTHVVGDCTHVVGDCSSVEMIEFSRLDSVTQLKVAQRAATREAHEEAGIEIKPHALRLFSRWLTPETLSKRFDAWFFMSLSEVDDISVDGGEIHDYQWVSPADALRQQQLGEITLPPPTFVTLTHLLKFDLANEAILCMTENPVYYRPKLVAVDGGLCSLYEEDAGYQEGEVGVPAPHHRLLMKGTHYEYVNSECGY